MFIKYFKIDTVKYADLREFFIDDYFESSKQ
jgi:hypothetical protein